MNPSYVLAVIAGVSLVVAAWVAVRYRATVDAARDAADAWKRERDAEVAARTRIELELELAKEKITALEIRVEELGRRPDLRSLERRGDIHEERAEARFEKVVAVLDVISERLAA